mmetsp:Transcript_4674/g.15479  ORF Transcript_4674/g.15479 Transcript_4674/m.15479 type:complete len:110 (-) Transcript_4674:1056-1385(-)
MFAKHFEDFTNRIDLSAWALSYFNHHDVPLASAISTFRRNDNFVGNAVVIWNNNCDTIFHENAPNNGLFSWFKDSINSKFRATTAIGATVNTFHDIVVQQCLHLALMDK